MNAFSKALSFGMILAALPAAAPAAEPPAINTTCLRSRLSALRITDAAGKLSRNYCALPDGEAPLEAQAVLSQVSVLNQKAAGLFQLPLEQLLTRPFELEIRRNPLGLMSSVVQSSSSSESGLVTTLTMGVFSDWKGEPLNAGVYSHELGHVIAENPDNSFLPAYYNELSSTMLVIEMVADLSALHATGYIVSPEPGLPACLQRFRSVTLDQSYDRPADDFTPYYTWNRFTSCCRELRAAQAHTAHSREFCAEYETNHARPPFASFGATRFSADFYKSKKDYVDPHQLGLPLNSFLAALQSVTGLDIGPRLIQAMREAGAQARRQFTCNVPNLSAFLAPETESQHSLTQALSQVGADLPPSAQEAFHRLWSSHHLDLAAQLAEIDSATMAGDMALQHGADAFNALYSNSTPGFTPDPRLRRSGCWVPETERDTSFQGPGSLTDELPGCAFVCTQLGG